MKIKLKKNKDLSLFNPILKEKGFNEILSHILLETKSDNVVRISGTNLETALFVDVECEVLESGDISLNNQIMSTLANLQEFELSSDDNNINIKSNGNFRTKTQGYRKDDFPQINRKKADLELKFQADKLKTAFKNTFFSTLKSNSKPFLQGVAIKGKTNCICFAGSDGFRLAEYKVDVKNDSEFVIIIPNNAVTELLSLLPNDDTEVKVSLSGKQSVFEFENKIFVTRVIEEKFPNYEQVIPSEFNGSIMLNKKELETGLKLISPYVDIKKNKIVLILSENKLLLSASCETGNSEYEIDCDCQTDTKLSMNINNLKDLLKIVDNEIELKYINDKSAITFKKDDTDNYIYITMPMRS